MKQDNSEIPDKLGKYRILSSLGRGAMGLVYLAHDPKIDRKVALKTVNKRGLDPELLEEALKRFAVEARAAGRLMHPNIVSVFDFDEDEDVAFITMEYVDGVDLKTFFGRQKTLLPLAQVRSILKQLLSALEYSHAQGVVHRDIKPGNVFVMKDGTIKLGDFGIAKLSAESTSMTQTGAILGTPGYMSPEHLGAMPLDNRSDLFSVGVMLYEMLTGKKPFSGDMATVLTQILHHAPDLPSKLNPDLPIGLDHVVLKAMAKDSPRRFQTAAEFATAFEAALDSAKLSDQATLMLGDALPEAKERNPDTGSGLRSKSTPAKDKAEDGGRKTNTAKPVRITVSRDGSGHFRSIGKAIAHAGLHDRIQIKPGIYTESLQIEKPLRIIGMGDPGDVVLRCSEDPCLRVDSDGVLIRNIHLRSEAEDTDIAALVVGIGDCRLEHCAISSRSRVCVSVRGRNASPHFSHCTIRDSEGVGVHFAMNSTGILEQCSLYGHKTAAVQVDRGAEPKIIGGMLKDGVIRREKIGDTGQFKKRPAEEAGVDLFGDSGREAYKGLVRGGLIGLTAGIGLSIAGINLVAPLVGLAIGGLLGYAGAGLWGGLLGCFAALVLLPLQLPETAWRAILSPLLLDGMTQKTMMAGLDMMLKGGAIGAATQALCGVYQKWLEAKAKSLP